MGFLSLPKVYGCPFSFSCVTLWQNEWWKGRAERSGDTAGNCTEPLGRGEEQRCSKEVVKWQGWGEHRSFIPSGSGALFHWVPPCKAKHHTSSPFCGCGGTASWKTPCPGAAGKTRRKKWNCVCMYSMCIYIHACGYVWYTVCVWSFWSWCLWLRFLIRNKFCGGAQAHLRSLSSNASSWIFVMRKCTACTSIKSMK